jgi:hypothetical protein
LITYYLALVQTNTKVTFPLMAALFIVVSTLATYAVSVNLVTVLLTVLVNIITVYRYITLHYITLLLRFNNKDNI